MKIQNTHQFRQACTEQADILSAVAGRDPTDKQTARLAEIESAIAEFSAGRIRRTEQSAERNRGGSGRGDSGPLGHDLGGRPSSMGNVRVLPPSQEQLDHDIGVALQSLMVANLDGGSASHIASEHFNNDRVSHSMSAGSHSGGGSWIAGEMSDRFIDLLRPMSVMRNIADELPLDDGTLTMPKVTSGPSGRYLGEDETANAEEIVTGDVKLVAKELVCIVPASEKLVRSPSAKASARILTVMLGAAADTEDLYFLRGVADGAGPTGLRHLANAANILTANSTITLANVTFDLGRCELALLNANVKMRRPAWIMSPRSLVFLMDLRDGNGNPAFPSLSSDRPMLRNKPVYFTTQIPDNGGGAGTGSEIMLVDGVHCLIGDSPRVGVQSSNTASYKDANGNMVSAFSDRRVVTRLVEENDFAVEYDRCVAVLSDVRWGYAS